VGHWLVALPTRSSRGRHEGGLTSPSTRTPVSQAPVMPSVRTHVVRLALPFDVARLAELRWLSREPHEQRAEPLSEFTPRFSAWLVTALESGFWFAAVAPRNTQLAGCMFLQRVATVPVPGVLSRHWGYITHAYVRAPHRNQSLGTSMLELLISQARQLQLHELHVWPSVAAASLYTRAGFLSPEQVRASEPPDESSYVLRLQ
jgi:GNAT superfamily N-acetyltransferase